MHNNIINGSCLCGQVQFQVELPSLWVAHCHCSLCRKAHGAGYVTWVGFDEEKFKCTQKIKKLKWYESSSGAQRGFCTECGSTMFFKSTQWPKEIHITLANLEDKLDKSPQANAYFSSHVEWMPIDETLKCLK
jgi:hypothetical protein